MMQLFIDRPPRIQPEHPSGEYEVPKPPEEDQNKNQVLIQMFLPLLTIIGYVLVATFAQGRSMIMIIPMGIAMVASSLLSFYTHHKNQHSQKARRAAYLSRIGELRNEMENAHDMQRRFYHYNYPDFISSLRTAIEAEALAKEGKEHSGTRLWERRPSDQDFGSIRLGIGTIPSRVIYKLSPVDSYDSPLLREAIRLSDDSRVVNNVPITLPLREGPEIAARHSIAVVGKDPARVYQFIQAVLVHFAAYHAPTDSQIYIAGLRQTRQHWRWALSLPHCKTREQGDTLCFEDEKDEKGPKEQNKLTHYWKNLRTILDRRSMILQERGANEATLPFLLVVVDTLAPVSDGSVLKDLPSEAAVSLLLEKGPDLGAAVIFLVPERGLAPSSCTSILEIDLEPNTQHPVFRYAEINVNTWRFIGKADYCPDPELLKNFANLLQPLSVRKSYGADLSMNVTLLDIQRAESVDALQEQILNNWEQSLAQENADWMHVGIGELPGGEVRKLWLSAKGDGVHGMIAGSTGSGKSELLMTLIIGLAINYHPSIINFVLVDYKGGTAFEPFRRLPHCVDIVTNLEGSATSRMFAAIKAELDRRQRIIMLNGVKDIVHYRAKGLHLRDGADPFPHLFIIIDEFAEMISGNAEFKTQLESITRLGRALGVTLILAAQRPAGVTDQMRANIKFRICLRVETPEDSRELLRRSDAAFLPPGIPGRGYLQVGNENIELIQVAHTGGDYSGPQSSIPPNVIWLNRPKKSMEERSNEEPPKLFELVVNMLSNEAAGQKVPHQWRPWPEFLTSNLTLQTPVDPAYLSEAGIAAIRSQDRRSSMDFEGYADVMSSEVSSPTISRETLTIEQENILPSRILRSSQLCLNPVVERWFLPDPCWPGVDWLNQAMRPVIGLIDNPYEARQLPMVANLTSGPLVIFGASGWGKTTFLRTLIVSLTVSHSPDDLHIYALDFGGYSLSALRDLPHIGAIISADEEERVQRLLRKLNNILEQRQVTLAEAECKDIYSYNHEHPNTHLPAILVIIDNFAEFRESYDNQINNLVSLVREGRAYGIHFVVTADQTNNLSGKLYSLFTERLTLKLSDPSEYASIVGRGVPLMAEIPGRGLVKIGRTPLEFQIALPFTISQDEKSHKLDEVQKLKKLVQTMQETWKDGWQRPRPAKIDTLPNREALEKILPAERVKDRRSIRVPLGIEDFNLTTYQLDFDRYGPHVTVVGPPNSGKTTTLRSILLGISWVYSPAEAAIVLVDLQRRLYQYGGQERLDHIPHVIQTVGRIREMEDFLQALADECQKDGGANLKKRKLFVLIDNYDGFYDEVNRYKRLYFEGLASLAREYGTDGLHFIICGSPLISGLSDELRKQVFSSSFGIGMQTAEAVSKLGGKIPRTLAEVELPLGRGFVVKSGRTTMIQIATPSPNDENVESVLDGWVKKIRGRYPKKAEWLFPVTSSQMKQEEQDDIKRLLKGVGYSDSLLASFGPKELLDVAKAEKVI